MKKIEVTTAQKVIIQYQLASVKDRIFAFLIDFFILLIGLILIYFGLVSIISGSYQMTDTITILVLFPIFIFYTFISEIVMNGQTLGKKAIGIKVIKMNGGLPTIDDYAMRWVFRSVDIYTSLGAIAALLVSSSDKAQRLGGLLSNTAVVKLREDFKIRLEDLERMYETTTNYEAQFPAVTQFDDEDMLAVKDLIKRYIAYPNKANYQLIQETYLRIGHMLQLETMPQGEVKFLQEVLKDYVALTR